MIPMIEDLDYLKNSGISDDHSKVDRNVGISNAILKIVTSYCFM